MSAMKCVCTREGVHAQAYSYLWTHVQGKSCKGMSLHQQIPGTQGASAPQTALARLPKLSLSAPLAWKNGGDTAAGPGGCPWETAAPPTSTTPTCTPTDRQHQADLQP